MNSYLARLEVIREAVENNEIADKDLRALCILVIKIATSSEKAHIEADKLLSQLVIEQWIKIK